MPVLREPSSKGADGRGGMCVIACRPSYPTVTFADYYLRANIEFRNKACTHGKYYSYTELYFVLFVFIYVYSHIYVRHVLAVALDSLP